MKLNSKTGVSVFLALFLGLGQMTWAKNHSDQAQEIGEKLDKAEDDVKDKAGELADEVKEKGQDAKDKGEEIVDDVKDKAKDLLDKA